MPAAEPVSPRNHLDLKRQLRRPHHIAKRRAAKLEAANAVGHQNEADARAGGRKIGRIAIDGRKNRFDKRRIEHGAVVKKGLGQCE